MNVWLEINEIEYKNVQDLLTNLKEKNIFVSPWIEDIFKKNTQNFKLLKLPISLYRVSLAELGFDKPTELQNVYNKAKDKGFNLVDPEVALISRELYTNQPTGEWLRIATTFDSMIDSDGVPHLPKLGRALNKFFIETYWSYPKAIFHPHNEFVLTKK